MTEAIDPDSITVHPADDPRQRPIIRLKSGRGKRIGEGMPIIYSNSVDLDDRAKSLDPGTLVTVMTADGDAVGVATFNPRSLACLRILDWEANSVIDSDFFMRRIARALAIRDSCIGEPFYRLINGEADGLPGLIIDRFRGRAVIQTMTAGMERLLPVIMEVLQADAVVLRNNHRFRETEGLSKYIHLASGSIDKPVEVQENHASFRVDLMREEGDVWPFDQRDDRRFISDLRFHGKALDLFAGAGGMVVSAAQAADRVVGICANDGDLALALHNARINRVIDRCVLSAGNPTAELIERSSLSERYALVTITPPPLVLTRKEAERGELEYRELARLSGSLISSGGTLYMASRSPVIDVERLIAEVAAGLTAAGRAARLIRISGPTADHPAHPLIQDSSPLKSVVMALD
jgi:23S rRNA (cytosine1962-C5)-methyltransferase